MRCAGRRDACSPDIAIPSSKELLGEPANVGAYVKYARENMDRSRLLFQGADLRYAIFSANEGLELCAKAYLLHYKAIVDPVATGHLPYPSIIKLVREKLALIGEVIPRNADRARQVTADLDEIGRLFKKLKNHKAKVALWKKSLGVDLGGSDKKLLAELEPLSVEWNGQEPPVRAVPRGGPMDFLPAESAERRAFLLALFHQKFGHAGNPSTVSLSGGKKVPVGKALYAGQGVALAELFMHTTAIVNGYVHQQISRYPTQIDGVDSSEVYAQHRGGVGRLLAKIHGACDALLPHLDSRLPPPFPQDMREALARE